MRVIDTQSVAGALTRHIVEPVEGRIEVGQTVVAAIDAERRDAIRRHHTGTHILHWALRNVLGDHVKQQGSYVGPDRLRFDFSHYQGLTDDEIRAIEDLANHEVLANARVRHYETTKENAEQLGAIAFFGDKYGDIVRVLEAGERSLELCGGTHVRALGDIGPMKIVSEGSIGSNIRRLEAIAGFGPIDRLRDEEATLARAAELVGVPSGELVQGIEKRLAETKELAAELRQLRQQLAAAGAGDLAAQAVDGIVVARHDGVDRDALRDLAFAVRDQPGIRAVILGGAPEGGGAALVCGRGQGLGPPRRRVDRRRGQAHQGRRRQGCRLRGRRRQGRRGHRRGIGGSALRQGCGERLRDGPERPSEREPGRAIGLDLGTKRIGVAVSDSDRTVATPIEVVTRTGDVARDRRRIGEIVRGMGGDDGGRRAPSVAVGPGRAGCQGGPGRGRGAACHPRGTGRDLR